MSPADLQVARDAEYSAAYREWIASLPDEERARLTAQGLGQPDVSRHTSTRERDDALIMRTPSTDAAPGDDLILTAPSPQAEAATSAHPDVSAMATTAADILASFCARIRAHPNPLLAFDAACYASGLMSIEGLSETALAARHGVTRAAFSKLVVQWSQTFGLPPSRGMRSKHARHSYRKARLKYLAQSHHRHAL